MKQNGRYIRLDVLKPPVELDRRPVMSPVERVCWLVSISSRKIVWYFEQKQYQFEPTTTPRLVL